MGYEAHTNNTQTTDGVRGDNRLLIHKQHTYRPMSSHSMTLRSHTHEATQAQPAQPAPARVVLVHLGMSVESDDIEAYQAWIAEMLQFTRTELVRQTTALDGRLCVNLLYGWTHNLGRTAMARLRARMSGETILWEEDAPEYLVAQLQ